MSEPYGEPRSTRVSAVRVCELPVVRDSRGSLSYGQYREHLPFAARRYFLVFEVPEGQVRGGHAHKAAEQFLVAIRGTCSVTVEDGTNRDEILLDRPSLGLYIPPMIWATQRYTTADATLLVLSSDVYEADEYIRDYKEFLIAVRR